MANYLFISLKIEVKFRSSFCLRYEFLLPRPSPSFQCFHAEKSDFFTQIFHLLDVTKFEPPNVFYIFSDRIRYDWNSSEVNIWFFRFPENEKIIFGWKQWNIDRAAEARGLYSRLKCSRLNLRPGCQFRDQTILKRHWYQLNTIQMYLFKHFNLIFWR